MTLVEVMVVVTLSIILLGLATSLLVAVQRRDSAFRDVAVEWERRGDLVELLRSDIRAATGVSLAAETMLAIEKPGGREVRYELSSSGCRRTAASEPGQAVSQNDTFNMGGAAKWTLETGPAGRRRMVIVTLNRTEATLNAAQPRAPLLVYATLSADLPATAGIGNGK